MMAFNDVPSDSDTMARFYEAHRDQLYKLAHYITKDSELAADALHDSFVSLMRYYDKLRDFPEDKLLAYSMAVVRHQCSALMKKSRKVTLCDSPLAMTALEQDADETDDYTVLINSLSLQNAVQNLQPNYRLAIIMRHYYDLDYETIALALNTKPEGARTILSRAHKQLKKLYLSEEVKAHE